MRTRCDPRAHADVASAFDAVSEMDECLPGGGEAGPAPQFATLARTILAERASLGRHMDSDLFADPARDILLFLFAEEANGGDVTTTSVCNAAGVPRTTALRWIKLLGERGLIVMSEDANDRRMTLLRLSPAARCNMTAWLATIAATRAI